MGMRPRTALILLVSNKIRLPRRAPGEQAERRALAARSMAKTSHLRRAVWLPLCCPGLCLYHTKLAFGFYSRGLTGLSLHHLLQERLSLC